MGALQSVGQGNKKTHEKKTKSGELQVGIDANQDNITGHFYVCNVTISWGYKRGVWELCVN